MALAIWHPTYIYIEREREREREREIGPLLGFVQMREVLAKLKK